MNGIKQILSFIFNHPLARKHKIKAFSKFLFWQLKCRISNKLYKINFIDGVAFYVTRGLNGITGNIYVGLHEFEDMGFLLHFLRKDDVFFDVGANVGAYTLLASGVKKAKSIAFEPSKNTNQLLRSNIALNNLQQLVNCLEVGIGAKEKTLWFTENEDTTNHVLNEPEKNSNKIEIVPLDNFYPNFTPTLIKIDVEGFEAEVLSGSQNILKSNELKAVIIELNGSGLRYGYEDKDIHETLLKAGFLPYVYNPFNRIFKLLKTYGAYNTLYLRDIAFVNNRINTAFPFHIFNERI